MAVPQLLIQDDPQLARRKMLAQQLTQQANSGAPVNNVWEGANKLAQALGGAWMGRKASEEEKTRQDNAQSTMADAMQAAQFQPLTLLDKPGGQVVPAMSKTQRLANILATNPDTAPMAQHYQMQDIEDENAMDKLQKEYALKTNMEVQAAQAKKKAAGDKWTLGGAHNGTPAPAPMGVPMAQNGTSPAPTMTGGGNMSPPIPGGPQGGYVQNVSAIESSGNSNAKNPLSSATGLGQFTDSTWMDMVGRHAPELAQGKSPQEILALRNDPEISKQMIAAYGQDNAAVLQKAGYPVTDATLYAAHRFGPGGVISVLKAPPETPMENVLSPQAMAANPDLHGKTVGQIRDGISQKMGAGGGQPASPAMPASAAPVPQQGQAAQPAKEASQLQYYKDTETGNYDYKQGDKYVRAYDPATGQDVLAPVPMAKNEDQNAPLFSNSSERGAALNYLISQGMTRKDAAMFAAGKPMTGPNGEMQFLTPEALAKIRAAAAQEQPGSQGQFSDPNGVLTVRQGQGPKFTQDQTNAATFAERMAHSEPDAIKYGSALQSNMQGLLGSVPFIGNQLVSPEYQMAKRAVTDFATADLRKESGSAISPSEFKSEYEKYFPQPGDTPEVVKRKEEARNISIAGMQRAAGAALNSNKNTQTTQNPMPQIEASKELNGVKYVKVGGQWHEASN